MGAIGLEPVADTENCLDIKLGVLAELLPQAPDMDIQRARADLVAIAPDTLQKLPSSDDFAGVLHQQSKEFILLTRQPQSLQIDRGGLTLKIEIQVHILILLRLISDS